MQKEEYKLEYQTGGQRGDYGTFGRFTDAKTKADALREINLHRDDKTRAETRPCPIWTADGTWKTYTSVPTHYRIVKVTHEVVEQDEDFRSNEGCF